LVQIRLVWCEIQDKRLRKEEDIHPDQSLAITKHSSVHWNRNSAQQEPGTKTFIPSKMPSLKFSHRGVLLTVKTSSIDRKAGKKVYTGNNVSIKSSIE